MGRLLIAFALVSFALFSFFTIVSTISTENTAEEKNVGGTVPSETSETDLWKLILVNKQNNLSRDFTVDLIKFGNTRVDYRISEPLQKMIEAAKIDGVTISVSSAYRSVKEQDSLYDAECLVYEAEGYSEEAGKILASKYLQPGGASEHHTGLAVDLLTDGEAEPSDSFAYTPAYEWLKENAAKYGFIERYQKDKSSFTGIEWEPWHFRYVGESNAEAIASNKLCLEEYLQSMDG